VRVEGWESLLAEYVASAPPFRWGQTDCALWTAEWVRLCTGEDHTPAWRGKYRTKAGATRLMRARGFRAPEDIADAHLNELPVRLAKRGDLLLHPEGNLGICTGRQGVFLTETGLTRLDTPGCDRAWTV